MRDSGPTDTSKSAGELLTAAKALFKAGQFDQARSIAHEILGHDAVPPQEAGEACNLIGIIEVQLGHIEIALEAFSRALSHAPGNAARYQYNRGLAFDRLGQARKAADAYRQVLHLAPEHSGARTRLAKTLLALGMASEAIAVLEAAPTDQRASADAAYLYGLAKIQLNQPEEGLPALERFLEKYPGHIEARLAVANTFNRLKRTEEAAHHLSKVLELDPGNVDANYLGGLIDERLGRHESAIVRLRACRDDAQRRDPAGMRLVRLLRRLKRHKEALPIAQELHARHPRNSPLIEAVANLLVLSKRPDELEAFVETTLAAERRPHVWNMLAIELKTAGRRDPAIKHWRRAAELFPAVAQIAYNGGHALNERGDAEEAELHLRRAIAIDGRYAKAWNSLGVALSIQHRYAEAILVLRTAEALDPQMETVWLNYGIAIRALDDFAGAIQAFRKAIEINQSKLRAAATKGGEAQTEGKREHTLALAHQNLAYTLLFVGEIEQGFREYEWRWQVPEFPSTKRLYRQPLWDGRPLPKHGVVVWTEQGMGDEVMFAWYFRHVRADVNRLIVDCDKRLIPTFARTFPDIEFIARDEKTVHPATKQPDIRYKAPAGHLPMFYFVATHKAIRNTWHHADVPYVRTPGYLKPDPVRQEHWRTVLRERAGDKLKIGISWRSSLHTRMRDMQYLKPEEIAQALGHGTAVINMQYSAEDREVDTLDRLGPERGYTFINPPGIDLKNDLDDIFALLSVVDLVISPLISLPWMAGAVGTPCWVFRTNETSRIWQQLGTPYIPWAPSIRLFFRHPLEDWSKPIIRIHDELGKLLRRRAAGGLADNLST